MKSVAWSVAKYALAMVLLYVLLRHTQTDKILGYLKRMPPLQLLLALGFISLAQVMSGMRMRYFFLASGFSLRPRFAIALFYVGAFYNFLLPGGIGGDAYKVFLARKRMNVTAKQGIRIMLADRASGLCVLTLTLSAELAMLDFSSTLVYARALILAGVAVTFAGYLFFSRWLLKQSPGAMIGALPYAAVVQMLWVLSLLTVWAGLSNGVYAVEYVALYCAASITGLLPGFPGGLGISQMTYFSGAQFLQRYAHSGVDGDLGIAISLCMFFLILLSSLPGLLWLNHVERADHA